MARPTTTSRGLALGTRPPGSPILPALAGTPKIMVAGDAVALGVGSSDGAGFRSILASRLSDAGIAHRWVGSQIDDSGRAHCCSAEWTMSELDTAIASAIASHAPDVVLLMAGRGNAATAEEFSTKAAEHSTLLSTISNASASRVVVGSVPPDTDAVRWERTKMLRGELPPVWAASGLQQAGRLVETKAALDLAPGSRSHLADDIHPNDVGYLLIAERLWPALVNALGLNAVW